MGGQPVPCRSRRGSSAPPDRHRHEMSESSKPQSTWAAFRWLRRTRHAPMPTRVGSAGPWRTARVVALDEPSDERVRETRVEEESDAPPRSMQPDDPEQPAGPLHRPDSLMSFLFPCRPASRGPRHPGPPQRCPAAPGSMGEAGRGVHGWPPDLPGRGTPAPGPIGNRRPARANGRPRPRNRWCALLTPIITVAAQSLPRAARADKAHASPHLIHGGVGGAQHGACTSTSEAAAGRRDDVVGHLGTPHRSRRGRWRSLADPHQLDHVDVGLPRPGRRPARPPRR